MPTRRQLIAATGGTIASGVLLTTTTQETEAVDVQGDFSLESASASVDAPPEAIQLTATGNFEVTMSGVPRMCESTLQVHLLDEADGLATSAVYDTKTGSYDFSVNLYEHRAVSKGDLTPGVGGEQTTDILVRVIVGVVDDGSLIAEGFVEDTGTIQLTNDGAKLSLDGSGSIKIQQ